MPESIDCHANALTRHVHLLACERGSCREAGPLHRREDRPIEIDALDARIRSDLGKLDVVHYCHLAAAAEASSGFGSFSEQPHVGIAVELDDDASAAGQRPRAVPQDLIQLVGPVAAAI